MNPLKIPWLILICCQSGTQSSWHAAPPSPCPQCSSLLAPGPLAPSSPQTWAGPYLHSFLLCLDYSLPLSPVFWPSRFLSGLKLRLESSPLRRLPLWLTKPPALLCTLCILFHFYTCPIFKRNLYVFTHLCMSRNSLIAWQCSWMDGWLNDPAEPRF